MSSYYPGGFGCRARGLLWRPLLFLGPEQHAKAVLPHHRLCRTASISITAQSGDALENTRKLEKGKYFTARIQPSPNPNVTSGRTPGGGRLENDSRSSRQPPACEALIGTLQWPSDTWICAARPRSKRTAWSWRSACRSGSTSADRGPEGAGGAGQGGKAAAGTRASVGVWVRHSVRAERREVRITEPTEGIAQAAALAAQHATGVTGRSSLNRRSDVALPLLPLLTNWHPFT